MLRQIIFTAVTGLAAIFMLSSIATAGDLKTTVNNVVKTTVQTVMPGANGTGGGGSAANGTPGTSGTGLPGEGLPNFAGPGGDNGISGGSDKLYVGTSSDGGGSYNVQIQKKILSF